jgi:hypothetical protein
MKREPKKPKYETIDPRSAGDREEIVANGHRWVKVNAARPWRPLGDGDVLIARYLTRAVRPGDNGTTYGVITLGTPEGALTISGIVISRLFDAAGDLAVGTLVRVVFMGEKISGAKRTYKDYDLYIEKDALA